jgi:hypothetical protein
MPKTVNYLSLKYISVKMFFKIWIGKQQIAIRDNCKALNCF